MSFDIDALLDELADRVAKKLAPMLVASASHYGTGKSATLPPGKSKAWALRTLKSIPGARKVGRDWVVSVVDFDAWASEQDAKRCTEKTAVPKPAPMASSVSLEERARRSLEASGFRQTR